MKGPGFRLGIDVRRVWKCPRCEKIVRTVGSVAQKRCRCEKPALWMQLIEGREDRTPETELENSEAAKSDTDNMTTENAEVPPPVE